MRGKDNLIGGQMKEIVWKTDYNRLQIVDEFKQD